MPAAEAKFYNPTEAAERKHRQIQTDPIHDHLVQANGHMAAAVALTTTTSIGGDDWVRIARQAQDLVRALRAFEQHLDGRPA